MELVPPSLGLTLVSLLPTGEVHDDGDDEDDDGDDSLEVN